MRILLSLLALLPAVPAVTQPQVTTPPAQQPSVLFADTATVQRIYSRSGPDRAIRVRVANTGPARNVRLRIEDLADSSLLSEVMHVPEGTFTLNARGATTLRAEMVADPPAVGIYSGKLIVEDTSGDRLAARELRITVQPAPPRPLDSLWTVSISKAALFSGARAGLVDGGATCIGNGPPSPGGRLKSAVMWLHGLAGDCFQDHVVPLAGGELSDTSPRTLLAVLQIAGGNDRGRVWWAGTKHPGGVELQFTNFNKPGIYHGRVPLALAGADGTVNLTVEVSHDWLLAFLVLVIGIWLSARLQRYLRSRRGTLIVESDLAQLRSRLEAVNRRLAALDSNEPGYLPFRISSSLARLLRDSEHQLRRALRLGRSAEADSLTTSISASLTRWSDEVREWEEFAGALKELEAALQPATARALSLRPAGPRTALLLRVERRFAGRLLGPDEVVEERKQIERDLLLVHSWTDLAAAVEAELARGNPAASLARDYLFSAETDSEIDAAATVLRGEVPVAAAPAASARNAITSVLPGGDMTVEPASAAATVGGTATREGWWGKPVRQRALRLNVWLAAEAVHPAGHVDRSASAAEKHERWSAFWYQAVTGAVIVLTGLNQVYFSEPVFGTPADYLGAFLWGFGGKLGIDLVRGVIEQREFPWPRWRGRQGAASGAAEG